MKTWTFMIFMAGDNNLSDDMIRALSGLEQAGSDIHDIAVTVYYDGSAVGLPTRVYDLTAGAYDERPDMSTTAETLRWFVEWSVVSRRHKAKNYALIVSGHGEGYQTDTFLADQNPRSSVSIGDFGNALRDVTRRRKSKKRFSLGRPFAIVGFDSCVMSTIEVASELEGAVDLMVGSQGYVSQAGWDYDVLFKRLSARGAGRLPEEVAATMVSSFLDANHPFVERGGRSADIAIVDMRSESGFPNVVKSVNRLGKVLQRAIADPESSRIVQRILLQAHFDAQTFIADQAIDILDFCSILAKECRAHALQNQSAALNARLGSIVSAAENVAAGLSLIILSRSIGPEYRWANGLSVYFPWSYQSFQMQRGDYRNYRFAGGGRKKETGWPGFLEKYLGSTMRTDETRPHGRDDSTAKADAVGSSKSTRLMYPHTRLTAPLTKLADSDTSGQRLMYPHTRLGAPLTRMINPLNRFGSPNAGVRDSSFENFRRFKNIPWLPAAGDSKIEGES